MLNRNQIKISKGDSKNAINLIIHETLHLMGMNFGSFKYFPKHNGNPIYKKNDKGVWHLSSPTLIKVAKEHFNCPTITSSKSF